MKHKLIILLLLISAGCFLLDAHRSGKPSRPADRVVRLKVTGYCDCQRCCGWKRNWMGRPVYAYGPLKGQRKVVGQTASGRMAHRGTVAADTSLFPFGTQLYIPGYGMGRVEDRGGDIQGNHIDVFFSSHQVAEKWGVRFLDVDIWE